MRSLSIQPQVVIAHITNITLNTMNVVVAKSGHISLRSDMLRGRILFTLACLIIAIAMLPWSVHRHDDKTAQTKITQSYNDLAGIPLGEKRYLSVKADTHQMRFSIHQYHGDVCREVAVATIHRLHSTHSARDLSFPTEFQLQQHNFREDDVTFFVTTGFIAKKSLLFQRIRCDHPGSLHLKATLVPYGQADSGKIIQSTKQSTALWLLPFESEVVNDNTSLTIEGEGELLLLWHMNPSQEYHSRSWRSLVSDDEQGDDQHPDLSLIADALEAAAIALPK